MRFVKGLLVGCSLLAFEHQAVAQTAPATSQSEAGAATPAPTGASTVASGPEVGDIVVTAQRRSQNLQKVPIAISVVSGDALRSNRFTDLSDVQYLAPSLIFTPAPQQNYFTIRGIGSQSFDYGVEQSVGFALDDVIQTLPRVQPLATLADVERVEVLRGPQGTLFGKNTTAGLVSITTKKPEIGIASNEGHLQYGSRNEVQAYDIVNVPLGDNLAARFRAAYQIRDSIYHNLANGDIADDRAYDLNGKLLWKPTDAFSVYLIGDYQGNRSDGGVFSTRAYGVGTFAPAVGNTFIQTSEIALGIVPSPTNREVALNKGAYDDAKTWSGQGTISYEFSGMTLTSVTAYKHLDYVGQLEVDSTPLTVFDNNIGTIDAHQFTQEVRLASPTGGALEYVIGGFFYQQKLRSTQRQSGGLGFLPNAAPVELAANGGLYNFATSNRSIAVFADGTLRPAPGLRLILGGRYTNDKVSGSIYTTALPGVCGLSLVFIGACQVQTFPTPTVGSRDTHGDYSGRAGLQYDLTNRIMAYAAVSRGYKAAAISTSTGLAYIVRPETVVAEEVGIKAQFLDGRLTTNLAVFHEKFRNFQAQVFDPNVPPAGSFRTGNAGGLRTQGVELDLTARPVAGLALTGGVTYDDAKFTSFFAQCYPGQTAAQGCTLPNSTFDASGSRLINAPKWRFNAGGNYQTAVGSDLKAYANANYSYQTAVLYGVGNPSTRQKGYGVLNTSVSIGDDADHVRVGVFAQNLLNQHFAYIAPTPFDTGGTSNVLPDAAFRRIGASLDWRF